MTIIKCERCKRIFYNKEHLERHSKRKILCTYVNDKNEGNNDTKNKDNQCEKCNKYFSRPFTLKRHQETICNKNNKAQNINNAKTKKGNINQIINNGDNNKIIIKQYNLFPFGKDGIDCLTTPEKIAIFSSDENPMEMIIVKVHLDPEKINHHNVGYKDDHSGYGIIFDGDEWLTERIEVILEVLLQSKEKDLLKIYDEIKHFLSHNSNGNIKNTLDNLNRKLRPMNKIDAKSKKNLIDHLKKHFFNNRNLVLEAKKHTENKKYNNHHKNNYNNILKDGYTIEDVDREIKLRKQKDQKLNLKKELAKDLIQKLDEIENSEYNLLIEMINNIDIDSINNLNIIIRLLNKSYCFGGELNNEVINNEIKKEEEINKILFRS
jgi:hypothetical protein